MSCIGSKFAPSRRLVSRLRHRDHRLAEPLFEAGLGEDGGVARHECALAQFCAEVARARIGDHFTWIVARVEASSDDLVQTKLLGARHFDHAVYQRSYGDPGN